MTDPDGLDGQIRALSDALAAMVPTGTRVGVRAIDPKDEAHLLEVELAGVSDARPARRHEFASGRALLRSLFGTDFPLPLRRHQSPPSPPGMRCSLAHDHEVVVAVVSDDARIRAIGIDVEPVGSFDAELATAVLRGDDPEIDARLAFVIKEAAYKAWSDVGAPFLEPHDVRITVDTERCSFIAVGNDSTLRCEGQWAQTAARWLAVALVY